MEIPQSMRGAEAAAGTGRQAEGSSDGGGGGAYY